VNPSAGRVLVVDGEPRAKDVVEALRAKGFEVERRKEARGGLAAAVDWAPDCVIVNATLPDIDGVWVARRVRTEPNVGVASTPILFLMGGEDGGAAAKVHALNVGVDACLCEPFTADEVAAQAAALIEMARRLRARRDSFMDPGAAAKASDFAFRGDLSQMPLATVLMVLEMERRRGILKVVTVGGRTATLGVAAAGFESCSIDGIDKPSIEVVREVLRWKRGRFWFAAKDDGRAAAPRESIGALLLESMRLDDEATVLAPDEVEIEMMPPSGPESKRGGGKA